MIHTPNACISIARSLILTLAVLYSTQVLALEHFPKPPELGRDVAFWRQVYTQVDTRSGYIHDAYNLAVIYETLKLPGQRRADDRLIKKTKARYAAILERLADSREGLDAEAQRVLALWPADTSAKTLRGAAHNLRFQRGQADRFRRGLARSGEWTDYIKKVLAKHNVPPELAALPHVESSFNPDAYSSVGAAGIWQFTRSTGRRYLNIDYVIDERMDPFTATVAAAQLLDHNYQLTGSWPLAITAYNHGAAGVRRATRKVGSKDIDRIVREYNGRLFGFASRNFYVSFLAAVEVSEHPERYFETYNSASSVQYAEVELPDYTPVDAFARAFNTDLSTLKRHNRALLDPVWLGKKYVPRGYTMRVPSDSLRAAAGDLLAAIPAEQRFGQQTPDLFHKVVRGDTVSEIASRYGHSVREVAAMNGLNRRYQIRIGQVLRLPLEGAVTSAEVNATDPPEALQASLGDESLAMVSVAQEEGAESTEETPQIVPAVLINAEMAADPSDYTVAEDDTIEIQAVETLGHYAEWLDLRASQLRALNGMRYGRALVIGHRLKLDFSRVSRDEFERRRLAYQYDLQQSYFMAWHIRSTRKHIIAPGESLWVLARREFNIPMWLLRQYNPDLDLDRLHPGTVIIVPELVAA